MSDVSSTNLMQVDQFDAEMDGYPPPSEMGWAVDGVDNDTARLLAKQNQDKQPDLQAIENSKGHING